MLRPANSRRSHSWGYVLTGDDEPLVFSILANHYRTPTADVDDITDRAVIALAEFSRR